MLKISKRGRFSLSVAAVVMVCLPAWAQREKPAQDERGNQSKRVLTFMTRNMDAGTDLNLIFANLNNLPEGVALTLAEVQASDIPGRAARLADEIRTSHPDFIGLQEVTTWSAGTCGATTLVYDQLQLLRDALAARHMEYEVVAQQALIAIEAPSTTGCAKFTDRNVILAAAELRPTGIEVSNITTVPYEHKLDLSVIGLSGLPPVERGYLSADIKAGSTTFRLVTTHLESTYPRLDPNGGLQALQAVELVSALNATALPVVLLGDFNSNAEVGPEQTPTVGLIEAAGFSDVWRQFNPAGVGYTWPLYLEDTGVIPNPPATPVERIDLIFSRGVRALKIDETGVKAPFASDHAGVVSMMQIGK